MPPILAEQKLSQKKNIDGLDDGKRAAGYTDEGNAEGVKKGGDKGESEGRKEARLPDRAGRWCGWWMGITELVDVEDFGKETKDQSTRRAWSWIVAPGWPAFLRPLGSSIEGTGDWSRPCPAHSPAAHAHAHNTTLTSPLGDLLQAHAKPPPPGGGPVPTGAEGRDAMAGSQ